MSTLTQSPKVHAAKTDRITGQNRHPYKSWRRGCPACVLYGVAWEADDAGPGASRTADTPGTTQHVLPGAQGTPPRMDCIWGRETCLKLRRREHQTGKSSLLHERCWDYQIPNFKRIKFDSYTELNQNGSKACRSQSYKILRRKQV